MMSGGPPSILARVPLRFSGLAGRQHWLWKEIIVGRLVSNTSMTVDGLCDVGAWFVAEGDHDTAGVDQLAAAAGFVTGRKCYEGFLGYWPSATGPWAEVLNPMPKYIASRSLSGDLDWLSLELLDVTAFESGVVLQRYRPQTWKSISGAFVPPGDVTSPL